MKTESNIVVQNVNVILKYQTAVRTYLLAVVVVVVAMVVNISTEKETKIFNECA